MSLPKLRSSKFLLIEDNYNVNILPLILEIIQLDKDISLSLICYEQPVTKWQNVFKDYLNVSSFYENLVSPHTIPVIDRKSIVFIDSLNQMILCLGWSECLKELKLIVDNSKVLQVIAVLHKDNLQNLHSESHLRHIAASIIQYDERDPTKIYISMKKSGKIFRSEEYLNFDVKTKCLKSVPIDTFKNKPAESTNVIRPNELTTFKIEAAQTEQIERHKLKLPYMSKINYSESKVYYEPDAVDDWDEEDPDDDLDI